jgi:beta-lactamase regulating signal transducer with metallopeptidase domain
VTSLSVLETLISLSVQVTVLICVAAGVARSRRDQQDADCCWATLHASILVLTAAAFLLPHLRLITWADLDPASTRTAISSTLALAGRICGWMWLTGVAAIIAVCFGGILRANSYIRAAAVDDRLKQRLLDLVPALAAHESIEIRVSPDCVSPFCWQLHRPIICLPEILQDFPSAEQAAIVRHELAHLRLQHPLQLFLQRLVEAIFWFHPLVWWASHQAAAAREFRCDRDAVRSRSEVADYLRSLLRLIESQVSAVSRLPAGLGFLGDSSLLRRRASSLVAHLDPSFERVEERRTRFVLIAACLCVVLWVPINPLASRRAGFSPWPSWSARSMDAFGVALRDYEVDGHRLGPHSHQHIR